MQPVPGHTRHEPRKRPPWQSYVPFYGACAGCLLLLVLLAYGVTHLVTGGGRVAAPPATPTATITAGVAATQVTRGATATATSDVQVSALPHADVTPSVAPFRSTSTRPVTPGGPHPATAAKVTVKPGASSTLVVARELDASGRPRKISRRFLSPALYLYAVATVHHVHRTEVLRFLFERNGKRMPNNDITFTATVDAAVHRFVAFADANDQETMPLSHGSYRVLFYRNGHLEAVTSFRVG